MAKKYITDRVLSNDTANVQIVSDEISSLLSDLMSVEGERFAEDGLPIYSNIAPVNDLADGSTMTQWEVGQDEAGNFTFTVSPEAVDAFTKNTIVVVATWRDEALGVVPQPEGEPLKRLESFYILALPNIADMRSNPKLRQYMDDLIGKDLLSKARSIAKKMDGGKDGFTLVADPVGMFLAASTRGSKDVAFTKMFTWVQGLLVNQALRTVEALKARGDHANAGVVKATFSRSRLSRTTLKACLSSQAAAEHYFPDMVNKNEEKGPRGLQWDNILRTLIKYAPQFKVVRVAKDAEGNPILKADGSKEYIKEPTPQSPAIFSYWLETRYQVTPEISEDAADVMPDFGEFAIDLD